MLKKLSTFGIVLGQLKVYPEIYRKCAQFPWYFSFLASGLAALRDSSLSFTFWKMRISVSESRTPASVPITQEVTLAVISVRVFDFGVGVE